MEMYKEHAQVVLTCRLDALGLEPGDVGTVVHVHGQGASYEVGVHEPRRPHHRRGDAQGVPTAPGLGERRAARACTRHGLNRCGQGVPDFRETCELPDGRYRLLASGRPAPVPTEGADWGCVKIQRRILKPPASYTRNGNSRSRLPVSTNSAFATAGAIGGVPGSPTPPGLRVLGTRCVSMRGASAMPSSR